MVYQLNKYHVVNKPSPLFVCVCVYIFIENKFYLWFGSM